MTDFKRKDGVHLHVIKETKFKTVRMMVRFREEITPEHLGKRVLLSNLLETTNAIYPTGKAFSRRLSELFGASFTTGVAKKGKQHLLSLNMTVVNPALVDFDTLKAGVDFLRAVLFAPDVKDGAFNPFIFKREQTNLIHYLEAMNDDRAYYASRQLAQEFFKDPKQALPSVGTVELIERETPQAVFDYYQEMLKTNVIDIFVLGDVDEARVHKLFSDFDFAQNVENSSFKEDKAPTQVLEHTDLFYEQELTERSVLTEAKEATQSILQLGYHLPVQYGDANYMTLQVLNGLLGGFAHSKLFKNVREKESLAYSISSTFDSFTGFLKIAAGIDAVNFEAAREFIAAQLEALQEGDFSPADLEQTKTMLRNTYLVGQDSISNTIELEYVKALLPERYLPTEVFLSQLTAVSAEEVARLAQKLTLQVEYFMKGTVGMNEREESLAQ
ncbi:EF-P 5-aminopentanol modification-associated protein YfmF [Lactococcus taiwanensis]|uniref:EF-P 5-aminopentanol modification-associated protein YfmF n=1 Tax=Lactococcus taiwanensis TaxID=1151742 RepID=UPI0035159E08